MFYLKLRLICQAELKANGHNNDFDDVSNEQIGILYL